MFNMLIDSLPESVDVGGMEYEINSDFRTAILFELLMQDTEVSDADKGYMALELFYPIVPEDMDEAAEKLLWFYSCGKEYRAKRNGIVQGADNVRRIYSFDYDDDYIYSAFLTQYRIDLQDTEYLHWWKFKAMFRTLSDDLEFSKIMEYRSTEITSGMTKEQREFYRKKKELYALPLPADEEEKIDAITEALMNGGDLTGII